MTLARPVYPGSASMITRRCTQRQFLLRPDRETNNAFLYCLAVSATRHSVVVMNFVQMSNHLHDAVFDGVGNLPAFYEDFHKLLAKCMNVYRGRWENFFATEQTNVVRLETVDALIDKLVYIATNPVRDGLVASVDEWPGANGFRALVEGRRLTARRPRHFFSDDGDMPEEASLELTIPPELGDREQIIAAVRERVAHLEADETARRLRTGVRVLGRYAVLRQSWRDSPTSREPRRGLRPTIAARSLWARLEAIQRKREFAAAYRRALLAYRARLPATFPYGTYRLYRFFGVSVETRHDVATLFTAPENQR